MLETFEMKPNFTYLGNKYNLDYRTVKKYYEGYEGKSTTRERPSKLDEYADVIEEKLGYKGIKITSIYFFLKEEKGYKGSYSTLTHYIRKHYKNRKTKSDEAHPRYETNPGEQMQFDWIESITMVSKLGEIFEFNVFSAELCYSRMHKFEYSKYKTREDVLKCLIDTFKYYGGVTESVLTDNMSSIVNTNENQFNKEFKTFAQDMGINARKCKVKHPETKGKVEVRNKFMKWLIPYNYEFETEEDLKVIIKKINIEVNNRINDTTQMKPILLYQKEKEYLKPLPSNQILEQYMNLNVAVKVHNTSLINYKGVQYSVPKKYINKTLKVKELENKLYIYDNTELVTIHDISNRTINYKEEHYIECLKGNILNKTSATIIITDNSNNYETNEYNVAYGLYKKQDDKWVHLELIPDEISLTLRIYFVDEDSHQLEMQCNWEDVYGILSNGEYKIVKYLSNSENNQNYTFSTDLII